MPTVVPIPTPKGLYSPYPSSCLASVQFWVKDFPTGVRVPNNVTPNQSYPSVGAVILTTESRPNTDTGHGGQVVEVITQPSRVLVKFRECNYLTVKDPVTGEVKGICSYRTLPADSPLIRGYWVPTVLAVVQ